MRQKRKVNANYTSCFSAYVVFLVILVSLAGIVIEPLMIAGVTKLHYGYIKAWIGLTAFSFIFSLMLATCFILNNASILRIGKTPESLFLWLNKMFRVILFVCHFFVAHAWHRGR